MNGLKLGTVVIGSSMLLYPVFVHFGVRVFSPRTSAGVLLVVLCPALIARLWNADRSLLRSLALLPAVVVALLLGAVAMNSLGFVLLLPAAVNLTFLASFAVTLYRGPPMVERFARIIDEDLTAEEQRWCRLWTWLWSGFFAVNASMALVLSQVGALDWWTAYNGVVSYMLVGILFAVEYVTRKYRFGRMRAHFADRLLGRLFSLVKKS